MSQEFDIHRELWDYCDDKSRRVTHFYTENITRETPEPSNGTPAEEIFNDPNSMIDLMDFLEESDQEKKQSKNVEEIPTMISLDTPQKIYSYMANRQDKK